MRYRAARSLLVRSAHQAGVPVPPLPDADAGSSQGCALWCGWLRDIWRVAAVEETVRHASPALARDLDSLDPSAVDTATVRRLALSLAGYAARLRRPTPFGLFAGVAEGLFADGTRVNWGEDHQAVARAGGVWLTDLVEHLEAISSVRLRLRVVASNVLQVRGDRLVLPWQPRPRSVTGTEVHEVSLRHTAAVRAAVRLTRAPAAYDDVIHALAAEIPGASPVAARELLDLLIANRMVLTSLSPTATDPDALGHVIGELRRVEAQGGTDAGLAADELEEMHRLMAEHSRPGAGSSDLRAVLTTRMRHFSAAEHPLAIDVLLDASVEVPRAVAWEAERAAAVLARVTPEPHGTQAWTRYRRRFQKRYGNGVLVPLLDLVDKEAGLGYPEDFHGTGRAPLPPVPHREAALLAHAQQTARDGGELILDDHLIEQIMVTPVAAGAGQAPAFVEMKAEIHAPSARHLDTGRFDLAVQRIGRGAGHLTAGRLSGLLARAPEPSSVAQALAGRPTAVAGALRAQLSFPPLRRDATHVARTLHLGGQLISVAEYREPGPDVIPLDDLAVTSDGHRLHLVSLSRRQPVDAAAFHPLQLEFQTPAIARFIDELHRGQGRRITAAIGTIDPWDWGAARHLPVLPRVRYGRSILSPASWTLSHAGLPGRSASTGEWEDAFTSVREQSGMPQRVYAEFFDNRLLLDLDRPAHLALMRAESEHPLRSQRLVITEAEPEDAFGWCEDRPTEIVALLSSTAPACPAPDLRTAPVATAGMGHVPGASPYLCMRLSGRPQARDSIIAQHVPQLIGDLGSPAYWITVQDDVLEPHLVLTLRLPSTERAAHSLRRLGIWATHLIETGALGDVHLRPYRPHVGLWGTGDTLLAAEDALATDTRTVAHQLAHDQGVDPAVLAAASIVEIVTACHPDTASGLAWLIDQPKPRAAPALPRELVHATRPFVNLAEGWPAVRALPGGPELLDHYWQPRRKALIAYRDHQAPQWPRDGALQALIDAHLRTGGHLAGTSGTPWRLARAAALSTAHTARP